MQKSIKATVEKKKYRQAAELGSTEEHFWHTLNTLRLGADGDDSAMKVRERELIKLVGTATTALMKKNSEAALNNFRDLMQVGHTPMPTPRGSRYLVVDYERPRTQENNMLIDLLAPDQHQLWRGTLRHNHLKGWTEKHEAMKHRYNAVLNKCEHQRERAQALAFSKEPFPEMTELEEPPHHVPAPKERRPAWLTTRPQEDAKQRSAVTYRSAPELSRPSTRSSLASSTGSRTMSRISDDVTAGDLARIATFFGFLLVLLNTYACYTLMQWDLACVSAAVQLLLEHLKQSGFSLNDAFAAVKTRDRFIDRDKLEDFLGLTPADKSAGECEVTRLVRMQARFDHTRY